MHSERMRLGKTEEDDELEAWKMKGYGRWMTGQAQMRTSIKKVGEKKRQRKGESKKGRQDEDKNIMLL